MSWLSLTPADGPAWTIRNESVYSDAEVAPVLQFLSDRTGGLTGAVTVRLGRARNSGAHYSGQAGSRRLHGVPDWVGTPLYMRLTLSPRNWAGYRRRARVCWHSTGLRKLADEIYSADGELDDVYARLDALLDAGETRFGRWPIYNIADWQEMLVHLAAHEVAHLIQYDRGRGAGNSEIFCETFALQILNEFRAARPCGDEPNPATGEVSPGQTPSGSLGLVAGPATAGSANQPEGAIMASKTEETAPTAVAASPAPKKTAAKTVDDPKGLFETLLASAREAVGGKTATTKKQEYVRLDVVVGGKNKTLAYIHHPTRKGVRSLTPNTKGGYDTTTVVKESDIPKAVKAISSRLDRVKATAAA